MTAPRKTTAQTANQTYTAQQACAVLGIKSSKFYGLIARGELETFRNGRRYVTAEAITNYQQEQMQLERTRLQAKRSSLNTHSTMGNANPQPTVQANTQASQ